MDQAIVHFVPTLHQYHAAAPGYGFDALTAVLEALRPDVLVVELTQRAASHRRPQTVKREYQNSVFPYVEQRGIPMVPMEPDEPLFTELVTQSVEAEHRFRERWPARHAEYEHSVMNLLQHLLTSCDSPAAFDSEQTDRLIERKHATDNELFGAACKDAWERWNEHFAQTIAQAARTHAGQCIVALAGFEHGYWLRPRLHALAQADGTWSLAPRLATTIRVAP